MTQAQDKMVLLHTDFGDMKIKLYNETPKHRDNFLKLVNEKFYDGLLFHRVINEFMIQGGDPNSRNAPAGQQLGMGSNGSTVPAEFNPKFFHKKGALCAARTNNPKKESSDCQFYIVQGKKYGDAELDMMEQRTGRKHTTEQREIYKGDGGTPQLDMEYTVYGEVVEGLDVIDKIAAVQKDRNDRPLQNVKMTMTILK